MQALFSLWNKAGSVEFARELVVRGWNIFGSRGTAMALAGGDVPVRDVAELVGEPILGHRVVTLSREVHAGILAQDTSADNAELGRLDLSRIDLVYVNMYPLAEEIAKPGATRASVIEMTDVGGPTLLHSAAKGERIVISDPADCQRVLGWLDAGCPDREAFIDWLAAKADAVAANYLLTSASYRSQGRIDGVIGALYVACKYGENAWQTPAALYRVSGDDPLALHNFDVVAGNPLGYVNWTDVDRLLTTMAHIAAGFDVNCGGNVPYIAIGVKHGNPCGAAVGSDPVEVIRKMVSGDPRAIFGGFVMTNFSVGPGVAEALIWSGMPIGKRRILDGIVAPGFSGGVFTILARKGGKCPLIANPALGKLTRASLNKETFFRPVRGGFLKQPNYTFVLDLADPRVERFGAISPEQELDVLLAWAIGSTSNSNTITLVKGGQLIGNGVGQQDRVGCAELAVKRASDAGHDTKGAAAYSDSFFPFGDGPEVLANAGVRVIFASSGSIKDGEVKEMCEQHGVTLLMVPDAVCRGFCRH
jgi:phosphoribosylaminoimidazolecarboxamide formyltransferase/IMP cyclohydrolase